MLDKYSNSNETTSMEVWSSFRIYWEHACISANWVPPIIKFNASIILLLNAIAIVGIEEASRNNSCSLLNDSTQNDCTPSNIFIEGEERGILRSASTLYIYWLAGATGCGVLWAIINTVTVACFSEIVRWNNKAKRDRHMKAIKARGARYIKFLIR